MPEDKETIVKVCPICGQKFECTLWWEKLRVCCSNACSRRLQTINSVVVRKCRVCGQPFEDTKKSKNKTCQECRFKASLAREERNGFAKNMRRCHDCGRPTHDYRCPDCWARLRVKSGIPVSVGENTHYNT